METELAAELILAQGRPVITLDAWSLPFAFVVNWKKYISDNLMQFCKQRIMHLY